ncbi:WhiB family transcriptional regulator [Rhodococcus sp. O3]|uniref:WhiB family transcriptional regulator n=1 Tax=Rhodococcus sp. O3 TaxID=3404919 RepID=UPI003B67F6B9
MSAVCSHSAHSASPTLKALNFCRQCPVAAQCLEYALRHDDRWGPVTAMNYHWAEGDSSDLAPCS